MASRNVETKYDGFVKLEEHQVPGLKFPIVVVRASDSVAGLLYDRTNHRVLVIRQSRVPMERTDNPTGAVVELVAGRFDVKLGPKALLVKEAKEEAGVTITEDDVRLLNDGVPLALSAGILTERCYLCYAEIAPDKIDEGDENRGVPEEGECISRIWIDADEFVKGPFECVRVLTLALYMKDILRDERRRRSANEIAFLDSWRRDTGIEG